MKAIPEEHEHAWVERTRPYSRKSYRTCACGRHEREDRYRVEAGA